MSCQVNNTVRLVLIDAISLTALRMSRMKITHFDYHEDGTPIILCVNNHPCSGYKQCCNEH